MLHNKSKALEGFNVLRIKIVKTDKYGVCHNRCTKYGQAQASFVKFLQQNGIVAQNTMHGSPNKNGVAERTNKKLLDMLRSMLSSSNIPRSLWVESRKKTTYILNHVRTKALPMTPFELFKCLKAILTHIHVR